MFQAAKAVYDFIVYCGCEIGKHNFTIRSALWDKTNELCGKTTKLCG